MSKKISDINFNENRVNGLSLDIFFICFAWFTFLEIWFVLSFIRDIHSSSKLRSDSATNLCTASKRKRMSILDVNESVRSASRFDVLVWRARFRDIAFQSSTFLSSSYTRHLRERASGWRRDRVSASSPEPRLKNTDRHDDDPSWK